MSSWTPLTEPTKEENEDEHIHDVVEYVRKVFSDDGRDNSKTSIDIATCNSSAFTVYQASALDGLPSQDLILLGSDPNGNEHYVTSMSYTILREYAEGNLQGGYAGFISYVPMVLNAGRGVFLPPGNAWPRDTIGMVTHHTFTDATPAAELDPSSLMNALNQVLVAVVGGCRRWSSVEKFLVGVNILEMLAKTIQFHRIALRPLEEIDHPKFDVVKDWRKMILVLVFGQNAPGLTNDIERMTDMGDEWLLNFFDHADVWEEHLNRNALKAFVVRVYHDDLHGSYGYYMDMLYTILEELEDAVLPPGFKNVLIGCREELDDYEKKGWLEPEGFDAIRHNAGEFFTDDIVQTAGVASGIQYDHGLQPMILPSMEFQFNVRLPKLRAKLKIEGEDITLESRKLTALAKEYQGRVTAFSILGNGISRSYVPKCDILRGSMVANIALSGTLGPAAGLWVLSHIIHGDLTVSPNSLACYAKVLAVSGGKLNLAAPISADIMRSIHSVTDGESIYSVWHPSIIMKLTGRKGEWHAARAVDVEKDSVKSCFILSKRPTASCDNEDSSRRKTCM